MSHHFQEFERL